MLDTKLRKNEKGISEYGPLDESAVYWDMYRYLDSASVMSGSVSEHHDVISNTIQLPRYPVV